VTHPITTDEVSVYATPTLFEVSAEVKALPQRIAALYRPIKLFGPSYTVSAVPADNLAVHLALAEAPSESVLVVTIGEEIQHGFWGEVMTEAALARGVRGLVTDGAVRDSRAIREKAFPVFCAAVAVPGTSKKSAGILNQPIILGEVEVRPGDYIVGDDDGVVIIPAEAMAAVIGSARIRTEKEMLFIEKLRQGESTVDLLNLRGQ
jgi:4-hydroxy-4-methyl-2-oxoglutarate aldolase